MIAIIGAGAWGRALCAALRENGVDARLYSFRAREGEFISISEAKRAQYLVFTLRASDTLEFLRTQFDASSPSKSAAIIASKGLCDGAFMSEIFAKYFTKFAVLSGPSFAAEIARKLPTAICLASYDAKLASDFASFLPDFIRTYTSSDVLGTQIAGVYKNIIAIASGISDALELGNNARAALLSRALVEMARFGECFYAHQNPNRHPKIAACARTTPKSQTANATSAEPAECKKETFLGLCGAGDLFLTASSTLSRNYRAGLLLAQNRSLVEIAAELGEVAEGIQAAREISQIAANLGIYAPIATQVAQVLAGKDAKIATQELLFRQ